MKRVFVLYVRGSYAYSNPERMQFELKKLEEILGAKVVAIASAADLEEPRLELVGPKKFLSRFKGKVPGCDSYGYAY